MKATSLIARRYLFSRKHISLVSTLTIISICGVTIGTGLLIIVLSVFNGFFDVIKSVLLAQDPDIRIEHSTGRAFSWDEAQMEQLLDHEEITIATQFVEGKSIVVREGADSDNVVVVRGVEPAYFDRLTEIRDAVSRGSLDLEVRNNQPGVLIPGRLSGRLRTEVGQSVSILSAAGMQRALTQFTGPRGFNFEVRGVYSIEHLQDEPVVYIDLGAGQRLFDMRGEISGIDIKLRDHNRADAVKASLSDMFGDEYSVQTWYDLQRPLYEVMDLEKWGAYFILMIIVLVAVLNIIGSLTMVVLQKTRDIGILRSYGFTSRDIRSIFLKQGLYIGFIGCGLGGALGLGLSWLQDTYGMVKLAGAEAFIIQAYPVQIIWTDVALVLTGSMILCLLASWYPARRAASVEPADAVRYE